VLGGWPNGHTVRMLHARSVTALALLKRVAEACERVVSGTYSDSRGHRPAEPRAHADGP